MSDWIGEGVGVQSQSFEGWVRLKQNDAAAIWWKRRSYMYPVAKSHYPTPNKPLL